VAERCRPALLTLLLIALLTSITAMGILLVLLVLATLARLGDAGARPQYRFPLGVPILIFCLVSFLSALVSEHRAASLLYLRHLHLVLLFFIAANEFRSGAEIRRALWWFGATVIVVSIYAMLQALVCTTSVAVPPWVAWALKLKLAVCRQPSVEPFRAKGFFSIYMTLGGSLVVALALLLGATIFGTERRRPAVQSGFALVALALTYVRNAWLGLGAVIAVLVLLSRRWVLLGLMVLAIALAVLMPSPLRAKMRSIVDLASPSATERLHFWKAGVRMIENAPLLGLGPGAVKLEYPSYKDPTAKRPGTSHLHNNFVQIAAERGFLGLVAWCAIWAVFLTKAWRVYAALPPARADDRALVAGSLAAVTGFLVAGLFEYNFGDSEVIGLVWVVAAFPFVVEREVSWPARHAGVPTTCSRSPARGWCRPRWRRFSGAIPGSPTSGQSASRRKAAVS
jgi:O-antigen ligase